METGVRRETAGAYLKAADIPVRPPGSWGRRPPAKPANEVSPDSGVIPGDSAAEQTESPAAVPDSDPKPANGVSPDSESTPVPGRSPTASACEPYFDFIELSLTKGRNAKPSIRTWSMITASRAATKA